MKCRKACLHEYSSIFIHAPFSDARACFKVKVTSQNAPQLLVSNKRVLADSKVSSPTSIELHSRTSDSPTVACCAQVQGRRRRVSALAFRKGIPDFSRFVAVGDGALP